jgi:hypothetical protein
MSGISFRAQSGYRFTAQHCTIVDVNAQHKKLQYNRNNKFQKYIYTLNNK